MISQQTNTILVNEKIADAHFRLRFKRPKAIRSIRPGQFLQIRLTHGVDPFLPRPLCVYDYSAGWVEVVYQVTGRGTTLLSQKKPGENIGVLGPLGNGFPLDTGPETFLFIAGGVGIASLYLTAKQLVRKAGKSGKRFILLFGSQTRKTLHCYTDFKRLGFDVRIATNDGTVGKKGFVTQLIGPLFETGRLGKTCIYACGPKPFFHALTEVLPLFGQDAYFSLDENMACGVGVCLGCAVRVRNTHTQPYRLICDDGPVFKMSEVDWDAQTEGPGTCD